MRLRRPKVRIGAYLGIRGTTSSFPNANENDKPVVHLDELDTDELRLVASFVELVRNWREDRPASRDVFQALWHRMTARATEDADDDLVMEIALEAQRAVRRAGACLPVVNLRRFQLSISGQNLAADARTLLQEARGKKSRAVDSLVDGNSVETKQRDLPAPHQHNRETLTVLH